MHLNRPDAELLPLCCVAHSGGSRKCMCDDGDAAILSARRRRRQTESTENRGRQCTHFGSQQHRSSVEFAEAPRVLGEQVHAAQVKGRRTDGKVAHQLLSVCLCGQSNRLSFWKCVVRPSWNRMGLFALRAPAFTLAPHLESSSGRDAARGARAARTFTLS